MFFGSRETAETGDWRPCANAVMAGFVLAVAVVTGAHSAPASANKAANGATVVVYNSTAFAGAVVYNGTSSTVGFNTTETVIVGGQTAVWTGQVTVPEGMYLFGVDTGGIGYARLWVDDHLLVDGSPSPPPPSPIQPLPTPAVDGKYTEWDSANIATPGHSMQDLGGDCNITTCGGSFAKCAAKCDALASQGCIGFVTGSEPGGDSVCYMRKLAPGESWLSLLP